MKTAYEASNSLEAHMIKDLLLQAGINAFVEGDYLQGGVGELPAAGFIRVTVNDADWSSARNVIETWEARETSQNTHPDPEYNTSKKRFLNSLLAMTIGLAIGGSVVHYFQRNPHTTHNSDYDGDGIQEEQYIYRGSRLVEVRLDRNRDTRHDAILYYDRSALLFKESLDNNFNGVFETHCHYQYKLLRECTVDRDENKTIDETLVYRNGVLSTRMFFNVDGSLVKQLYYENLRLTKAEQDSNLDGSLDTGIDYDRFENPLARYPLQ